LGTAADNARDRAAKGRNGRAKGATGGSTLTADQVLEIRSDKWADKSTREIGAYFGVRNTTIRNILIGRTWSHLPMGQAEQRERGRVKGERAKQAKITASDIAAIRSAKFAGWSTRALAQHFGISKSQAHRILRRKGWAHV